MRFVISPFKDTGTDYMTTCQIYLRQWVTTLTMF